MNILILTGKFGMGHYSASEAVKQEIEKVYKEANIEIVDILDFLIPSASKLVYDSFEFLVSKFENVYNSFYKVMGQKSFVPLKGKFVKSIDRMFDTYSPDIVISTLPLSSQYISDYKRIKNIDIPLITYITDISWHDEWIAPRTDYYFVGAEKVRKYLIEKGVPKKKIKVSGIPVKQTFKEMISEKNNSKKELLIMGGGLGLIGVDESLYESLNQNDKINTTVITGNNKKMYNHIKNKYKNINVLGYTRNVYEYMQKSDLLVSKAGGITLYEAIYSEVPIYVIRPFLVQELRNAKYIEEENIGKVLWKNEKNISNDMISLLYDDNKIISMKNNMKKIKENLDKDDIIMILDNLKKEA